MLIQSYDSFLYRSVWKILEIKDGCIFRTENTNLFIRAEDVSRLPSNYTVSSISTKLTKLGSFNIEMFPLETVQQ